MKKLLSNITFHGIDIDQIFEDQDTMNALSEMFINGIKLGIVKPLDYNIYSISNISNAISYLASGKHTEKIILDMSNINNMYQTPKYYTYVTHLITSRLGGIGMILTKQLIKKCAEHIILSTTRGIINGEQKLFIQKCESYNCKITIIINNLENIDEVKNIKQKYGKLTGI